jgi:hypothetical protein
MKQEYIKITTPDGAVNVVPSAVNRDYYERVNASTKDEKCKYKIEEAGDEDIAKYFPAAPSHSAGNAAVQAENAALRTALSKQEAENVRLNAALAAASKQIDILSAQVEKLQKAGKDK